MGTKSNDIGRGSYMSRRQRTSEVYLTWLVGVTSKLVLGDWNCLQHHCMANKSEVGEKV